MAELDHWHPVLRSEELRKKPVGVRVAGRELVVFRAGAGLGALPDRCPHRAMRLSEGKVEDGKLRCPYHGWRWAPDGRGEVPGSPSFQPCAEHFDTVERLGAIWIKSSTSSAAFPRFDVEGWSAVGRLRHVVEAPLELVLDNFTEVEHTGETHRFLGHDTARMAEVESKTTLEADSIRVTNVGPQRRLPALFYPLLGIPRDALFVDDWTTWFSPVHAVYDQYWLDARTRAPVGDALRIAVFFNPITEARTELFTLAYARGAPWGRLGLNAVMLPITRALVDLEVERDRAMLGRLADKSTSIRGNLLGRFDKALVASRQRIDRIYRGRPGGALPVVSGPSRSGEAS